MNEPDTGTQTLAFTGLGRLHAMRLLVCQFTGEPTRALEQLSSMVTFGRPKGHIQRALQLALTPTGLRKFGVPIHLLPRAVGDPLASAHHRRILGDHGPSSPEHWLFNGDDADLVLLVYAEEREDLQAQCDHLLSCHVDVLYSRDSVLLDEGREHFGFHDGLSNPTPGEDTPWGEFVLGYPDATNEVPQGIELHGRDFSKDGTYLVLRQLEQDVEGFWSALKARAKDPIHLAQKMIGRTLDGEPLAGDTTISYARDAHGLACPRGAHIRRANPRDAKPDPEFPGFSRDRHRILRRGRTYGHPAPPSCYPTGVTVTSSQGSPSEPAESERGLLFMCLCTDVARQFEFVQQSWLNNPKQEGLFDEIDPISSAVNVPGDARRFTTPSRPLRTRTHEWPSAVRVRGTAYALMPSSSALRMLYEQRS